MEEFCSKSCMDKYTTWKELLHDMTQVQRDCIEDDMNLRTAFKECDSKYSLDLDVVSDGGVAKYGGDVVLR